MSVKVNETSMVYPAEKTPRRSLWLSRLDMMIRQPFSHTRILHYYHPIPTTHTNNPDFFDSKILKSALSRSLVPFYPLAGRLKMNEANGRYEIDCNEEGALFVEAKTRCALDGITPAQKEELIQRCDYSKGLSSFPLLIVQITRFSCGGVTLGIATSHHVGDGAADMLFKTYWACLARGVEPPATVIPCHDRALFLAPRRPFQVTFRHLEYEPSFSPVLPKSISGESSITRDHVFKLSGDQVDALIREATKVGGKKLSTFKVVSAHVWRSVCKARGLADDQDVKVYMHTDGRSRLKDPPLPQGYFGNVVFFSSSIAKAGELVRNPLWYTAGKIDEAVKRMDNSEYLRSAIDYLESEPNLKALVRGPHSVICPNLQINSWTGLPFSVLDFGWGEPKSVGPTEIKAEGQCTIVSSLTEDKCFYVTIKLFEPHMVLLKDCFYDFEIIKARL